MFGRRLKPAAHRLDGYVRRAEGFPILNRGGQNGWVTISVRYSRLYAEIVLLAMISFQIPVNNLNQYLRIFMVD